MESLDKIANGLEISWHENKYELISSENAFYILEIEKEFYEDSLSISGYGEETIENVLKHMGY